MDFWSLLSEIPRRIKLSILKNLLIQFLLTKILNININYRYYLLSRVRTLISKLSSKVSFILSRFPSRITRSIKLTPKLISSLKNYNPQPSVPRNRTNNYWRFSQLSKESRHLYSKEQKSICVNKSYQELLWKNLMIAIWKLSDNWSQLLFTIWISLMNLLWIWNQLPSNSSKIRIINSI